MASTTTAAKRTAVTNACATRWESQQAGGCGVLRCVAASPVPATSPSGPDAVCLVCLASKDIIPGGQSVSQQAADGLTNVVGEVKHPHRVLDVWTARCRYRRTEFDGPLRWQGHQA